MSIILDKNWLENTLTDLEKGIALKKQDAIYILGIEFLMAEQTKKPITAYDIIQAQAMINILD